jgi:hypothetical protein
LNLKNSQLFLRFSRDDFSRHFFDLQCDFNKRVKTGERRRLNVTRNVETPRNDAADDVGSRRKAVATYIVVTTRL